MLLLVVALPACISGGGEPVADDATGVDGDASEVMPLLEVVDGASEIYCNNTEQFVGEIRGAEPGEQIVLSSPKPIELSPEQLEATADADGAYRLTWRCSPTEAGQPWDVRVQGERSGRRVTVSFTGTAVDPETADVLAFAPLDHSFVCDGSSRSVGELSNAAPWETVTFTAEGVDDLVDGTADGEGSLMLRWECSPDEAATWQVTARGVDSNRVGELTIVGTAPPIDEQLIPTIQIDEHPFICDGGSRAFATLSGFLPGEVVDFTSLQASRMTEGQADDSGDLEVRWTCGSADAGTVWELTATGARSRRTVTFTVTGAAPPPAPDPIVTMTENPFRCDGTTRFMATISGFLPREFIDFTSPRVEHLRQGQADETGALQVRWTCGASDVDRVWDVTATGAASQRSVTFQITGAAP